MLSLQFLQIPQDGGLVSTNQISSSMLGLYWPQFQAWLSKQLSTCQSPLKQRNFWPWAPSTTCGCDAGIVSCWVPEVSNRTFEGLLFFLNLYKCVSFLMFNFLLAYFSPVEILKIVDKMHSEDLIIISLFIVLYS